MSDINQARVWTFRGLVLVGTAWLLYSWFLPWWSLDIHMLRADAVVVRPWGEESNLGAWQVVFDLPQMPAFFAPFAWIYLGLCIILLLSSLLVKEKRINRGRFDFFLPQAIIGAAGLAYIVVPAVAAIVIAILLRQYEVRGVTVPLQGTVFLDIGEMWASDVTSRLRLGYWLAWGAGIFLIVLALLRQRIIGRG